MSSSSKKKKLELDPTKLDDLGLTHLHPGGLWSVEAGFYFWPNIPLTE